MKKQLGGIVNTPVIGVVSNRPNAGQPAPKLPDMYDKAAIEAQRQALRQEEANRGKQQGGN